MKFTKIIYGKRPQGPTLFAMIKIIKLFMKILNKNIKIINENYIYNKRGDIYFQITINKKKMLLLYNNLF